MGKRKPCDEIIIIDGDSPASEDFGDQPPKRCSQRTMIKKLKAENIEGYNFGNQPSKRRSQRNRITKQKGEEIKGYALIEDFGDRPSKRRSQRNRITKKKGEEIEDVTLITPCSIETSPLYQKSVKRLKGNKAVSGSKKMLDSLAFESHFRNLWRDFPEDRRKLFTYFDSLWFLIYMTESSKENMLTWVKDKDIFSKKYVLVPIVYWSHWSLLIFCNFGERLQSENGPPCMLLLDSLQMAGPRRLEPAIRKFVLDIYRSEGRPETEQSISQIPLLVPKVPQQRNGEECGICVLYYINLFVEQAPKNFSMKEYPYFMTDKWFNIEDFKDFCEKLEPPEK